MEDKKKKGPPARPKLKIGEEDPTKAWDPAKFKKEKKEKIEKEKEERNNNG